MTDTTEAHQQAAREAEWRAQFEAGCDPDGLQRMPSPDADEYLLTTTQARWDGYLARCRHDAEVIEGYSDVLRELCFRLSVGGYNSYGLLPPKLAFEKINSGIDLLCRPLTSQIATLQSERDALRVELDAMKARSGEVAAWLTDDLDRAVTAKTKATAERDGGAILSSLKSYSVPAYLAPPAEAGQAVVVPRGHATVAPVETQLTYQMAATPDDHLMRKALWLIAPSLSRLGYVLRMVWRGKGYLVHPKDGGTGEYRRGWAECHAAWLAAAPKLEGKA